MLFGYKNNSKYISSGGCNLLSSVCSSGAITLVSER